MIELEIARKTARAVLAILALGMILAGCAPYAYRSEVEALGTATRTLGELGERQRDWEDAQRTRELDRLLEDSFEYSQRAGRLPPTFALSDGCDLEDTVRCYIVLATAAQTRRLDDDNRPDEQVADDNQRADELTFYSWTLSATREQTNERIVRPLLHSNTAYQTVAGERERTFQLAPAHQFAVLKLYAEGLLALTDADDLEGLEKAHTELATSLAGVMLSIGPNGEATQRSALGSALGGGFGLLQRAQLNRRRLRALRRTVPQSNEDFAAVLHACELYVHAVRAAQLEEHRQTLRYAVRDANAALLDDQLEADGYAEHFHRLDTLAGAYTELRLAEVDGAFGAIVDAHAKLSEALNRRSTDWVDVAGFVHAFATSVEALNTALDAFEDEPSEQAADSSENGEENNG